VLVIHALWSRAGQSATGRLVLWAEDPTRRATPPHRVRRPHVPAHPFALGSEALADVLGGAAVKAAAVAVTLRLPQALGTPLTSPELILDELRSGTCTGSRS
jgi:hypothetical protein